MAVSTSAPGIPVFGPQFLVSGNVPSVQLTLEHDALPVRPTKHNDNSRDLLKRVQKEDSSVGKKRKGRLSRSTPGSRERTAADKVLLQKGIILSERPRRDSLPLFRSSSPMRGVPESFQGASKLSTIGGRALSNSPQLRTGVRPELVNNLLGREEGRKGEAISHSLDALHNLKTFSNSAPEQLDKLNNKSDSVDVASSPDSGYANTPDTGLHMLSPNSRSRSVSSENSSTVEDAPARRISPSSGLWSGHESTLEYVMEEGTFREESKEEREEESDKRESSSSDEGSGSDTHNHSSSPCERSPDGTLTPELSSTPENSLSEQLSPVVDLGPKYFHPQEDVLIHVNPRRPQKMGPGNSSTLAGHRIQEPALGHGKKGRRSRPRALTASGTKGEPL